MARGDVDATVSRIGVASDGEVVVDTIVYLRRGTDANAFEFLREPVKHSKLGGVTTGSRRVIRRVCPLQRVKIIDTQVCGHRHPLDACLGRHDVELRIKCCVKRECWRRFAFV